MPPVGKKREREPQQLHLVTMQRCPNMQPHCQTFALGQCTAHKPLLHLGGTRWHKHGTCWASRSSKSCSHASATWVKLLMSLRSIASQSIMCSFLVAAVSLCEAVRGQQLAGLRWRVLFQASERRPATKEVSKERAQWIRRTYRHRPPFCRPFAKHLSAKHHRLLQRMPLSKGSSPDA